LSVKAAQYAVMCCRVQLRRRRSVSSAAAPHAALRADLRLRVRITNAGELATIRAKLAKPDLKKFGVEAKWGFHEWLDGKTGKIAGGSSPYQAWTAGSYIFACHCVKEKRVLLI